MADDFDVTRDNLLAACAAEACSDTAVVVYCATEVLAHRATEKAVVLSAAAWDSVLAVVAVIAGMVVVGPTQSAVDAAVMKATGVAPRPGF